MFSSGRIFLFGYRYFTNSQKDAYETLVKSCYEAAHSRDVKEGLYLQGTSAQVYYVEELYNMGYMDRPADPKDSTKNCFNDGVVGNKSKVTISLYGSGEIPSYKYVVDLRCPVTSKYDDVTTTWTTSD